MWIRGIKMNKKNTTPVEITNDDIINAIYDLFNRHNIFKDFIKNTENQRDLIKVLHVDGSINDKITYGTPEFDVYIKNYIQNYLSDPETILNPDGTIKDKVRYNLTENTLLKIVRKPLTVTNENNPEHTPRQYIEKMPFDYDDYKIKEIGKYGLVNPGPKGIANLLEKIERRTRTGNLSMADAIDLNYNQKEDEIFNTINDWSRFSIIVPNYAAAPKLVAYLLGQFGGDVKVHDKKHDKQEKGYEALHLNFNYKDINTEIQIHTKDYLELKKATDIFYHTYVNIVTPDRSLALAEKEAQLKTMVKYCKMIQQTSDFQKFVPEIEEIKNDYAAKSIEPKHRSKLKHFCMACQKANAVQNELADTLPTILKEFINIQGTELIHDSEEPQKQTR